MRRPVIYSLKETCVHSDPSRLLITVLRSVPYTHRFGEPNPRDRHKQEGTTMASLSLAAVAGAPDSSARCTCTWLKETAHLKLNRDKWPSVKVILLWAQAQLSACSRIPSKRARLSLREFARVWLAEVSSFDRIAGSSSTPVSRSFFSLKAVGL